VGVCNNTTVLLPLVGNDLSDIGAITLFINYDDQRLVFNSLENIDPQLEGIMVNTLTNPSRVGIVWSKTTGASFPNSSLLSLKFDLIQSTADLNFIKNNCEIANVSIPPQIIDVTYQDGSVYPAKPDITSEPENKTVSALSNVIFQVVSPNATAFSWQESRDNGVSWSGLFEMNPYTGTQTNSLSIHQVPASFDHFQYRCILNSASCPVVSTAATLSIDSHSGISGQPGASVLHLTNSPNPFSGKTTLEYSVPERGFVTIKLFSMTGQFIGTPVESLHDEGLFRIEDSFINLPVGIYFCRYAFKSPVNAYETYRKIVKIK